MEMQDRLKVLGEKLGIQRLGENTLADASLQVIESLKVRGFTVHIDTVGVRGQEYVVEFIRQPDCKTIGMSVDVCLPDAVLRAALSTLNDTTHSAS